MSKNDKGQSAASNPSETNAGLTEQKSEPVAAPEKQTDEYRIQDWASI